MSWSPASRTGRLKSKKLQIKLTRSGNPFTHSLDFLAKKLVETGAFDDNAWANLQLLLEIRDSSIHFYNLSGAFAVVSGNRHSEPEKLRCCYQELVWARHVGVQLLFNAAFLRSPSSPN